MAKLYRKMRDAIERCFRMGERQAPKIEPADLNLSAMGWRTGRILAFKCQTTSVASALAEASA